MATAAIPNPAAFLQRVTRDQRPESEFVLNFTALAQVSTPASLRTDRKIKWYDLHFRGRITNGATGPTLRTAPQLLGTQVFSLIQQVTLRGQHLRYGAQTPIQCRGEFLAEYMALFLPNYIPQATFTNSAGGTNGRAAGGVGAAAGGALSSTANATIDVDFVLPIPTFPLGISMSDAPFYAIHGPDWPGNLYMDILFADGTALATANPPVLFAGYGGVGASPTVEILSERCLIGKGLMTRIQPAVTFRIDQFGQPTATVTGAGGTGVDVLDLIVGKDTTRIIIKTGTGQTGQSAGVVAYIALSDGVLTRSYIALDNRQMGNSIANSDSVLQDYMARSYGRVIPVGYKLIDFIDGPGAGPSNPKAAFQSSTLTAARKFQLLADVTAAANQVCDVIQEMTLGVPNLLAPAKG